MLRPPLPRFARRVPSWPGVLLACALSVLLLAAVHCSSYLVNDGHQHLSLSAPAVDEDPSDEPRFPDRPRHDHGSACASPCLTTWASNAEQRPAEAAAATAALLAPDPGAVQAEPATGVVAHTGRSSIARAGRSTLANVCRWRI